MRNQNVQAHQKQERLIRALSLVGILTLVEGIVTLFFIVQQPSEIQTQVFLGFSIRRWSLIFTHIACLLVIGSIVWGIWQRTKVFHWAISITENQRALVALIIFFSALLAGTLELFFRIAAPGDTQTYFSQIRPYLIWLLLAVLQIWLLLLIRLWKPLWNSIQACIPLTQPQELHPLDLRAEIILILIGAIYVLLQLKSFLDVRAVGIMGDSVEYILPHVNLSFTDLGFWIWSKPWVTLAIYRLVGYSLDWIDFIQTAFSAIAWLVLAYFTGLGFRKPWLKIAIFPIILGFSLTEPVQVWNHVALSESLSISMMVIILANSISLVQKWRWYKVLTLCLLLFLWTNTRESNIYISLMVAVGLFFFGLLNKTQRYTWAIVLSIFVAAAIQLHLSNLKSIPRWVIPLGNVITQRILPDQEYRNFFKDHGMPLSPEVMSLSGQWIYSDNLAFFDDKNLRSFQKWFYSSGRITYIKFLVHYPAYTIQSPLENISLIMAPIADLEDYRNSKYMSDLPLFIHELLFPLTWFWLYLWVALPTLGWLLVSIKWTQRKAAIVFLIYFLLSIPHFYLAFHGDSAEVGRHSIQANIQCRLSMPVLFFYYLETADLPRFNLLHKIPAKSR